MPASGEHISMHFLNIIENPLAVLLLLKLQMAPAIKKDKFQPYFFLNNVLENYQKLLFPPSCNLLLLPNLISGVDSEFYCISLLELNHKLTQSLFFFKVTKYLRNIIYNLKHKKGKIFWSCLNVSRSLINCVCAANGIVSCMER